MGMRASDIGIAAVHSFLPIVETRPNTGFCIGRPQILPKNFGFYLSPNKKKKRRDWNWKIGSVADDLDVTVPAQAPEEVEKKEEQEQDAQISNPNEGGEGVVTLLETIKREVGLDGLDTEKKINKAINAGFVLFLGTFAITKLLTIDHDYWHGWTLYEILRYAPEHNWTSYEDALKTNPVIAKMVISGVVYSLGDWIAQCYEGKPLFEFDRARMFRSGLVGFSFHGSLSHYYYHICEALFPSQDWWIVPAKVLFDQTVWAAIWNSIYFVLLGFLRLESPYNILSELKATFLPMLTAGWKLWPFAHLITYGVIPVEQRLLWVDCVELVWVTILSTYSNEKSQARSLETPPEKNTKSPSSGPKV